MGRGRERGGEKRENRAVTPPWPAPEPCSHPHNLSSQAARTEVAAELAEQPAPGQRSHSQAAIPVATTEQQLSIRVLSPSTSQVSAGGRARGPAVCWRGGVLQRWPGRHHRHRAPE